MQKAIKKLKNKFINFINKKLKVKTNLINLNLYKLQGYDTLYIPVSGIGDGILFTAVAKALYKKNNKKVLVSHKHNELFQNNPYIETIDGFYDTTINKKIEKKIRKLGFDLIYPTYWNFPQKDGKYYLAYPKQHIIAETASKAGYSGQIELKPEIFLTEEEKKFGRFTQDKKQIVIMSTALDKHKQWDKWQELVNQLKDKYYFVQLGAPSDVALYGVDDRRGQYTLRECASVLYNSDLFVGQIGGLMHMARAVDCPAVIAYTGAEPLYFDSYVCNENVMAKNTCRKCISKDKSAYSENCDNDYECVKLIKVEDMIGAIEKFLEMSKSELAYDTIIVDKINDIGMTNYYKRYSKKLKFYNTGNKEREMSLFKMHGNKNNFLNLYMPKKHKIIEYMQKFKYYDRCLPRILNYISKQFIDFKFIDIGANIGDTAQNIRLAGLNFPILAIEGDEKYFSYLQKNMSFIKNIDICNVLLSNKDGFISAKLDSKNGTANFIKSENVSKVQTLDNVLNNYSNYENAKFLKIDTDGFDNIILKGARNYLLKTKPIIYMEYDPNFLIKHNDNGIEIFEYLYSLGYNNAIMYQNFGEYMFSFNFDNKQFISEMRDFFYKNNRIPYADLLIFNDVDFDLFKVVREQERKFFNLEKEKSK